MNISGPLPPPQFSAPASEAGPKADRSPSGERASPAENRQGLDSAQLKQLSELKARDREVRAHEAAHQAAGGQYTGAISYVYERGPDGAQYAVGGEVSIDTSPIDGNPQATIEKMRTVRSAALAPAEPSSQDRAVAAQAMQLMLQAQAELSAELSPSDDQKGRAGDESNVRVSRDAAETYQSVSGFEPVATTQEVSRAFQARA